VDRKHKVSARTSLREADAAQQVLEAWGGVGHPLTNATAEGLNSKIQMVKEMACGFRNREHYKTAIYSHCGGLDVYPRLEAEFS
jgi:transposase